MLRKKATFLLLALLLINYCFSRTILRGSSSKESIILEQLKRLSDWSFYEEPDFNIDSLNQEINTSLLSYLTQNRFTTDSIPQDVLNILKSDSILTIYNYGYESGGTAGKIMTSIVQWKKTDGSFGTKLLESPAFFYEIHTLNHRTSGALYLFIGNWRSSGRVECAVAHVIEIRNDTINLSYPAFYNQYPELFYYDDILSPEIDCIACIAYDAVSKKLSITDLGADDRIGPVINDQATSQKFLKGRKEIHYFFNGSEFIEK